MLPEEMSKFGFGVWIKNEIKLRQIVEGWARTIFRKNRDPQEVTLWYLILGKKNILLGLYKSDIQQQKIYEFLSNDFSNPEWQVKASKNAFELMKQHRYELAAAFFFLGGRLEDMFEVLANHKGDVQQALITIRLVEGENGQVFKNGVRKFIL